jgi:Neuraminidase (sialidase)
MATLADGRVLAAFRLSGGIALWQAYSSDNGRTWSAPKAMAGMAQGESVIKC